MRFIPYARQSVNAKDIRAVEDTLKSDYLTQGPRVFEFEGRIARYCGAKYAVALNSGTSALHAACFSAGIGPDDEVITSPISFAASANCVLYCGGKPVFADVLEDTVTINPAEIKKRVNQRTKAIIPVDFAGHPAELYEIKKIALRHGLLVIEDAAHALGAEYKGKKVGGCRYSDMTILSFHAVKHITTGEGGVVLTNSKDFYEKLIMFRNHGITRNKASLVEKNKPLWFYEMQSLGYNYRITDIQCALGISQLSRLDYFVARRREIAAYYKEGFNGVEGIACLNEKEYVKSSWHIFPIRVKAKGRNRVFNKLRAEGIGVNLHYIPIYLHLYYKKLGYRKGECPKAEKYFSETITLPLFPKMTNSDVNRVITVTKNTVNNL